MKFITRPVVIESLEFTWLDGWSCRWRPVSLARGVPDGGGSILGFFTIRQLLRRLNWWTEPMEETPRHDAE
jgi:hypothetical protein